MFVVLLEFSNNKSQAGQHMDGHKAWIKRGLDDGVFLLVGSLQTGRGGAILAHDVTPSELQARVDEDPFVVEDVVRASILGIDPAQADERLGFLLG